MISCILNSSSGIIKDREARARKHLKVFIDMLPGLSIHKTFKIAFMNQ